MKKKDALILGMAGLILFAIIQPWKLYFLNDDYEHIPMSDGKIIIHQNFLRPVSNLFLLWDKWLYNQWAPGYHFTTLLLHLCTVTATYLLVKQIAKKYLPDLPANLPLLTALIFLFYPFHAEPIMWIIGRVSIEAALFTLLSLLFYLRKNEHVSFLIASVLFYLLALFTYESIWTSILLYGLVSVLNARRYKQKKSTEIIHLSCFVAIFIIYLAIRFYSIGTLTGGYTGINQRFSQVSFLISNFLKLVARNYTPPFYNSLVSVIFFAASSIVYVTAVYLQFKRNKTAGCLMLLLLAGVCLGVLTAIPLGIDTHRNESERYIYYSSFFFCFFLALAICLIRSRSLRLASSGLIIVASCIALAGYQKSYVYSSVVTQTAPRVAGRYPHYRKAYFADVPHKYNGALIFRSGLPEAIHWLAPQCNYDSVIILNQVLDASGQLPYKTGEKSWLEFTRVKSELSENFYFVKDSSNKVIALGKPDVLFWFAPDGLYKINAP